MEALLAKKSKAEDSVREVRQRMELAERARDDLQTALQHAKKAVAELERLITDRAFTRCFFN